MLWVLLATPARDAGAVGEASWEASCEERARCGVSGPG